MSDNLHSIMPMDLVRLKDGTEAVVNSAHYHDFSTGEDRQMFSVCGSEGPHPGPLYYADETQLIHRCEFKPYGPVKRCSCGRIYTTMADTMLPREPVTWQ